VGGGAWLMLRGVVGGWGSLHADQHVNTDLARDLSSALTATMDRNWSSL
jgi:hypothetical protein